MTVTGCYSRPSARAFGTRPYAANGWLRSKPQQPNAHRLAQITKFVKQGRARILGRWRQSIRQALLCFADFLGPERTHHTRRAKKRGRVNLDDQLCPARGWESLDI